MKTTMADQITWAGLFEGVPLRVVSTVRLAFGNMAHFVVHSGARIGAHAWNLPGGHYVDLRIYATQPVTDDFLRRLGQLAATEEDRPIHVRRAKDRLSAAIPVIAANPAQATKS